MKRYFFVIALLALLVLAINLCPEDALSQEKERNSDGVIRPAVASGRFYPSNPAALQKIINDCLKTADSSEIEGRLIGLVEPHAGYIYSGVIAAYGYNLLKGRKFETVVVLGPSHSLHYPGSSIYNIGDYETPLGIVRVDRELCNMIINEDESITYYAPLHRQEHSVEVQLPFLQTVLGDFSLVPIVIGEVSKTTCRKLANALVRVFKGKDVLFIASSDMSHYYEYSIANLIDEKTNRIIEQFSPSRLLDKLASGDAEMCGGAPVATVMMVAKELGAEKVKVLKYANSGDTAGDKSQVVGYSTIAFFATAEDAEIQPQMTQRRTEDAGYLSDEARKELLKIARQTIVTYFSSDKIPEFEVENEELKQKGGAFVTLKNSGRLRGCIGDFSASEPLYVTVSKMALQAIRDPRFLISPVTKQELPDIDIEISALSPLRKIKNVDQIEVGKHGIYIIRGSRSGCFLPQVAVETGWTRTEFLEHCCSGKAGLSPDAWKEEGTEIFVFTAEVFGEEDGG